MSAGFTESINTSTWSQVGEDGIEIRIPVTLPTGVRVKDISICIKDSCILVISAGPTKIIEWRLYGPVLSESEEGGVEWVHEDGHIVIDLKKKFSGAEWTNLLDLPIRKDDSVLLSKEDLNKMIAQQFPPQVFPSSTSKESQEEKELEQFLDGALQEVVGEENKEQSRTTVEEEEDEANLTTLATFLRREREMMISSEKTLHERLTAARLEQEKEESVEKAETTVEAETEVPTTPEETEDAKNVEIAKEKQIEAKRAIPILEEMLALNQQVRDLRTKPTTIDSFIETIRLSIDIAIANFETKLDEPYNSEDEKQFTATQLMTLALSDSPLNDDQRLHFLRLAAIRFGHPQCIAILFGRDPDSPLPSYLMLKRALDDENRSAEANHIIGDLFSAGSKYFVAMFPAAVYFYQRAAQLGYVAAMLSLAQLWSRGSTETSLLSEEDHTSLKNIDLYHKWIQKAVDRGSGASMFVKGCAHINGEYGLPKSYAEAKRLLDAAGKTGEQVSHLIRESNVLLKLQTLRKEEEENAKDLSGAQSSNSCSGTTSGFTESSQDNSKVSSHGNADRSITTTVENPVSVTTSTPSSSLRAPASASEARLNALSSAGGRTTLSTLGTGRGEKGEKLKKTSGSRNPVAAARQMKFWERAGRVAVTTYGLFILAFPLRVVMMPTIYEALTAVVKVIPWLGNPDLINF